MPRGPRGDRCAIAVDELAAVTEVTVTDGDRKATFFFGTYRGTADATALASDPGLDGDSFEPHVADSVPATSDESLVRRLGDGNRVVLDSGEPFQL